MLNPCRRSALRLPAHPETRSANRLGNRSGRLFGWNRLVALLIALSCSWPVATLAQGTLDFAEERTPAARTRVEQGSLWLELETRVPGQKVSWVSNANDWDEERTPLIESRPGFYSLKVPEPWVPTLAYKFVVDGRWQADPTNPRREPDGVGGWNSLLDLSFEEDPLLDETPGAPYIEQTFSFRTRGRSSRTVVALRPKASSRAREAVVIYFQDGGDYLERASVRRLLSHLALDPTLPPFAAVLIPPMDRMKEYGLTAATLDYSRFLRHDVIPRVEGALGMGGDRWHRAMIGPSLGGLVTLYLAVDLQDLFATAISQSGSVWYKNEAMIRFLETAPLEDIRLALTVGFFETPTMVRTNRTLAGRLATRGDVTFSYQEFPSVHDWRGWRNQLSVLFKSLFTVRSTPETVRSFSLRN